MAKTALMKAPSPEVLAALAQQFPIEEGYTNVPLSRISFVSQDVTKETGIGRTKKIEVIVPAGTFYQEVQTEEVDPETGKPVWDKVELGSEIEFQVFFQRKQLKYFDAATTSFVSSNVYDDENEEVTLFANKTEIARGTPAELKKAYEAVDKRTGKVKSDLRDNRVLYALFEGEPHQLNIGGTSMYAWLDYAKKARPSVPAVITGVTSEPREQGSTKWNCMVFSVARTASPEEAQKALDTMGEFVEALNERKARFAQKDAADKEFNALGSGK